MGFKAFRGSAFKHSHENQVFNDLYDILKAEWTTREDDLHLLGNFFVEGKEFDALIIKNNAIIIIDFKNFGGKLSFSENNNWFCDNIVVKGGNSKNPFLQIRNNKFALMNYLKNRCEKIHSAPNLGHIAGLIMFHKPIELDENQIPKQIKSWFHISELGKAIRTIDGIVSAEIDMYPHELDQIVKTFDIPEYFPDGKPTTKIISSEFESVIDSEFVPIGSQKSILAQVENWLTTEKSTFVLKGMSSTGKRTLLREIIKKIQDKNKSVLLIAPNARLAKKYTETQIGEFVSIYQVLYSNKSDGVVKKTNGIELAKHSIILTHEVIGSSSF